MQEVYTANHPTDEHLVKGLLEASGIAALVRGEAVFGLRGEVPFTIDTLPTVWVLDDSAVPRARELVAEYVQRQQPGTPHGRPWKCPKCGEQLEPQFTDCWQCGTPRPGQP